MNKPIVLMGVDEAGLAVQAVYLTVGKPMAGGEALPAVPEGFRREFIGLGNGRGSSGTKVVVIDREQAAE